MRWQAVMLLGLATALCACGGIDGGSSGTGITTAEGNVVNVVASAAAHAAAVESMAGAAMAQSPAAAGTGDLAGIDVAVEGTSLDATTDGSGAFSLRGPLPGVFTLVFSRPGGETLGRITVTIPGGGTLNLHDVSLDVATQSATAVRQDAVFQCTIAGADCPGGTMSFVNLGAPYEQGEYVLALAGSSLENADGSPLACQDLVAGHDASVQGQAFPDLTFGDAVVTVEK